MFGDYAKLKDQLEKEEEDAFDGGDQQHIRQEENNVIEGAEEKHLGVSHNLNSIAESDRNSSDQESITTIDLNRHHRSSEDVITEKSETSSLSTLTEEEVSTIANHNHNSGVS